MAKTKKAKSKKNTLHIEWVYERGGYIIEESAPIQIGYSDIYIAYRNEKDTDSESEFPRIVVKLMGDGAYGELDSMHLPTREQCKELSQFFDAIAKLW